MTAKTRSLYDELEKTIDATESVLNEITADTMEKRRAALMLSYACVAMSVVRDAVAKLREDES